MPHTVAVHLLVCTLVLGCIPPRTTTAAPTPQPARRVRLLFVPDDGTFDPARQVQRIYPALARAGIDLAYARSPTELNEHDLRHYDCLVLHGDRADIGKAELRAVRAFVASGGGLVAICAAGPHLCSVNAYRALVGGCRGSFRAGPVDLRVEVINHPVIRDVVVGASNGEAVVHTDLSADRVVLIRDRADGRSEPWAWVRGEGRGRVFYTAWGRDRRAWASPSFRRLLIQAVRWTAGAPLRAGKTEGVSLPSVEARIPNYVPGAKWGTLGHDITRMQLPLTPAQSMRHLSVAPGFHVELFAAEPDIVVPLAMAWDAVGRLWLAESVDYPNARQPAGAGHDRIKICQDTNGDRRADTFTIFADKLSIPTSLTFANGGLIVAQAPDMLFLKDTDGDGRADVRRVLFTGWGTGDTHAGPSNLHRGLDNWIWGTVGYAGFDGTVGGTHHTFRQGIFRFRPDGSRLEFMGATSNNTWGLGLSEAGLVFASTANGQHSLYLPIPARYYDRVRGWHAPQVPAIADHERIHPITEHVRQVDWHGRYTAAAGSALYTARAFPRRYWNRAAFVAEPTGHLVHQCFLERVGSGFVSHDGWDLVASDDAWTAPIAAEVGPDGAVWWIDWYNFIVQHNPIPQGFKKGSGNAYVTPLRDKQHGRVYRVVSDDAEDGPWPNLEHADPRTLVATLDHKNMFWRLTAQRLLVDRHWQASTRRQVAAALIKRAGDGRVDEAGTNWGAVGALWTLRGLGMLTHDAADALPVVRRGLRHRAAGVRRAAIAVLPASPSAAHAIIAAGLLADPNPLVRQMALLRLAEMPASEDVGRQVFAMLAVDANRRDRWLVDAATAAAARHATGFVHAALAAGEIDPLRAKVVRRVVTHIAAGDARDRLVELVTHLPVSAPNLGPAIVHGVLDGWPSNKALRLSSAQTEAVRGVVGQLPPATAELVLRLVAEWGVTASFQAERAALADTLEHQLADTRRTDRQRQETAARLLALRDDARTVAVIVQQINPRQSPEFVRGSLAALAESTHPSVAPAVLAGWPQLTPAARRAAIGLLLARERWAQTLIDAIASRQISADELAIDQRQRLIAYPNAAIADRARRLLAGERPPLAGDRQRIVAALLPLAQRPGEATDGHAVFLAQCAKCHTYRGEGAGIGPDLTGFAVRSKAAILAEVLDPNRSVEGNYRQYSVITQSGRVFSGLLVSESRNAIELLDTDAKTHLIERVDVDRLLASNRSIMPEGFERLPAEDLVDLLEFLTQGGRFVPLSLEKAATAVTLRGMFYAEESVEERLVFPDWKPKVAAGVPFRLIDPAGGRVPNAVVLYSPQGNLPPHYPHAVEIPCGVAAKAIHLLGGVAGWGYPLGQQGSVSMIVRIHYADGSHEDHPLNNGRHIADYIRRVDVPESQFAFLLAGRQIRYLAIRPRRAEKIDRLELIKGPDNTAPLVMAVTVERVPSDGPYPSLPAHNQGQP